MPVRALILVSTIALAACKPPAADEYSARGEVQDQSRGPSVPVDSPDSTDAFWADGGRAGRIIYGQAGQTPYLAISCEELAGVQTIRITRFVAADREAQAVMVMIGNGHTARLPVDAQFNGQVWLWEGQFAADDQELETLTGPRQVELTIPGAGSVILNPSPAPAQVIEQCRAPAATAPAAPK